MAEFIEERQKPHLNLISQEDLSDLVSKSGFCQGSGYKKFKNNGFRYDSSCGESSENCSLTFVGLCLFGSAFSKSHWRARRSRDEVISLSTHPLHGHGPSLYGWTLGPRVDRTLTSAGHHGFGFPFVYVNKALGVRADKILGYKPMGL